MKFTTCFDQESQPSRLLDRMLKHSEHRVIDGILTLHDPFFQRVMPGYTWLITRSLDYNSSARLDTRFNLELFPLHSPLLGESLLVSFPPLNNMLKFSGSSRLIRVLAFVFYLPTPPRGDVNKGCILVLPLFPVKVRSFLPDPVGYGARTSQEIQSSPRDLTPSVGTEGMYL
jgi:hypothetical protein